MQNKTAKSTLSTVLTITAVSSCLMLAAVGTYRLTSDSSEPKTQTGAENTQTENTENTEE